MSFEFAILHVLQLPLYICCCPSPVENITWRGLYERQPHVLHTYSSEMLRLFLMSAKIKIIVHFVLYTTSSKTRHLFSYKLFRMSRIRATTAQSGKSPYTPYTIPNPNELCPIQLFRTYVTHTRNHQGGAALILLHFYFFYD
jgi:hypothetical protein